MTMEKLRLAVLDDANDFHFDYNGESCGLELTAIDGVMTFEVWYGEFTKQYDDFDEMADDKFFGNMSLRELVEHDLIEIDFA